MSTILFDLGGFLSASALSLKALNEKPAIHPTSASLDVRSILSTLLTTGINDDIDLICRNKLSIPASSGSPGIARYVESTDYH